MREGVASLSRSSDVTLVGINLCGEIIQDVFEETYADFTSDNSLYLKREDTLLIYDDTFENYLNKSNNTDIFHSPNQTFNMNLRKYRSDYNNSGNNTNVNRTENIKAFVYCIPIESIENFEIVKYSTTGKTYQQIINQSINETVSAINNNSQIKYVIYNVLPHVTDFDWRVVGNYIVKQMLSIFRNHKYYCGEKWFQDNWSFKESYEFNPYEYFYPLESKSIREAISQIKTNIFYH